MNFSDLTQAIIRSNANAFIKYIQENQDEIKLLFLNISNDVISYQSTTEAFLALNQKGFNNAVKETDVFQGLVNQFALHFKKTNRDALVASCRHLSLNHSFRNRIDAYILIRAYNDVSQHITRIEEYFEKISSAIYSAEHDYSTEIVDDIEEYFHFGKQQLEEFGQANRVSEFVAIFEKDELIETYPILTQVLSKIYNRYFDLPVNEIKDKVQEPTIFSEALFEEKIIRHIKQHPDTVWHEKPFGYTKDYIRYEILSTGLADFDQPFKNLLPRERVKLYCYFNLRKHYFTSYSIFERLPTLLDVYQSKKRIKFIDIGCGPATSGLALIDFLNNQTGRAVLLDYFGIDIFNAMLEEANDLLMNDAIDKASIIRLCSQLKNVDIEELKDGSCLIVNTCYLFASSRLDVEELASFVNKIRKKNRSVPKFLLFQNPNDRSKNSNYFRFKELIKPIETQYSAVDIVYYNNKRNSPYKPVPEHVFYELLKL